MVAADARTAITFALSPGNAHDAPEGRELLRELGSFPGMPVIMDRAYEGNETRQLVLALDMVPAVPPKSNRVEPWRYDGRSIRNAMKSSVSSAASRVTAASSPASRNWIVCSLRFSASLSSSKRSDSVNTP
jgi:hypothetical protein